MSKLANLYVVDAMHAEVCTHSMMSSLQHRISTTASLGMNLLSLVSISFTSMCMVEKWHALHRNSVLCQCEG